MRKISDALKLGTKEYLIILCGILLSVLCGFLASYTQKYFAPGLIVLFLGAIIFLVYLFKDPIVGLYANIIFMFFLGLISREGGGMTQAIPMGIGVEILLILTLLSVWYHSRKYDLSVLKSDFFYLVLAWFIISVVEVVNPAGASVMGWLQEIRSAAFQPLTITIIGLLVINTRKRAMNVIILMIACSVVASLYGMRQHFWGLTTAEQDFLNSGAASTHMLFGKLRVFSFFSDAGQFGASQAQFAILCIILALGLPKISNKLLYLASAGLLVFGMLISGTRGALFALLAGAAIAVLATKKIKFIVAGSIALVLLLGFLKFTSIGNSNYNIMRMRSALSSEDASLNVRFNTQEVMKEYMKAYPFGGGLGVIGAFGTMYNSDKFLSTVQPDSYWVKVWAMYGIVGLVIFFCGWMYLIGKSFGIVWKTEDKRLRTILTGMLATVVGLFVCSYGNEVMNGKPSVMVIYLALAIIFVSPKFDTVDSDRKTI